ncbi:phosphoinositide phospholipase C 2 [Physcomitrium patens]|uniref:Phosphoinositide phospholipase C n=1 Tax=Physcomitrium patens TaxID=3218 RepID=A0A2K1KVA1_PHYPA|nr:phosphoinositide phospholipase C 2-like [Physcomitrium patens]PNR57717.1 hypothetical protein PHYPA_004711 [Physcomitrium patens]|eukprot:XP_024371731.1 phosphoinositide phospholipase C 2-like [Physcomitrella patens]
MGTKDTMGCYCLAPHAVSPFSDCRAPDLVQEEFKKATGGNALMDSHALAIFLRENQGEEGVTDEEANIQIRSFLAVRAHSGRHKFPGMSQRHSKRELSGRQQPATLDISAFVKFLLNPESNGHQKFFNKGLKKQPTDDMTAPLSHYYIFASHNTYLTGNQLVSKCSTRPIVKALLNGCRVIELDCHDGKDGKIKVLHGGTLTKPVDFEDCIKEIKKHAFTASDYPVILTIESHLDQEHQKRAAMLLKEILGDMMFIPSPEHRPPIAFLSPEELKNRIIISDKPPGESVACQIKEEPETLDNLGSKSIPRTDDSDSEEDVQAKWERKMQRRQSKIAKNVALKVASMRCKDDENPSIAKIHEFEELLYIYCQKPKEMEARQVKGGPLVAGDRAIMANLAEPQLYRLIKEHPSSLTEFSKTNLGRVYPFGLRIDSSNANPTDAWSHGLQVAAINMQGHDRPVWISQAFFKRNGGCGYVKKPDFLLPGSTVDFKSLQPKLELTVKVLLGTDWHRHYDIFKKPDYFVKVAIHGFHDDEVKKRTEVKKRCSEPHWSEVFVFPLRVPELAILRLEVGEHDKFMRDDMVGQSCLPVTELRQGIRAVKLESKKGQPRNSKLLCDFSLCTLPRADLLI